jgi:cytochrome c
MWHGKVVFFFIACGVFFIVDARADEALAKAKGCMACHTMDKKLIGPSYKDMARKYAGQKDAEAKLSSGTLKGTPIPGGLGWQKEGKASLPFMLPTPGLKPEEAARLSQWILKLKY